MGFVTLGPGSRSDLDALLGLRPAAGGVFTGAIQLWIVLAMPFVLLTFESFARRAGCDDRQLKIEPRKALKDTERVLALFFRALRCLPGLILT